MNRSIPIVMDAGALSEASAQHARNTHDHGPVGTPAPVPVRPPSWVRVGDTEISEAEIAREMQHHRAGDPHKAREEAVRALVVRELLRLEVERLGILEDLETLEGESPEEAGIRVLLEREAPTPQADADSCRRYYEQNQARLRAPDRIRVRHILLAALPADADARAKACVQGEELIAELRQHPERFTEFAQRHSDCPSKDDGGELGWVERGDTTPEFERQLFMLKPGLAGLTVESRWGHHVVQIDAIEPGAQLSFEQAEARIAVYLEAQTRQNAIHQYLQILRERYFVRGLPEDAVSP